MCRARKSHDLNSSVRVAAGSDVKYWAIDGERFTSSAGELSYEVFASSLSQLDIGAVLVLIGCRDAR